MATVSVAQRVAEEMGCALGALVGYQVRFDDCTSEVGTWVLSWGCGRLTQAVLGSQSFGKGLSQLFVSSDSFKAVFWAL